MQVAPREPTPYFCAEHLEEEVTMPVFPTTILLATDGSQEGTLALETATELSRSTGSEVHLVYVLPTPAQLVGHRLLSNEAKESAIAAVERDAETFLKEQAEKVESNGGKLAESHLRTGEPDKEILRTAEGLEAGLIVIGSRGLGAITRTLVGSVSDSVVRHAHCPVFVVRH
jgi:nucleotide-binding universal stress UspA family protein